MDERHVGAIIIGIALVIGVIQGFNHWIEGEAEGRYKHCGDAYEEGDSDEGVRR